jgi:hypothetical protein
MKINMIQFFFVLTDILLISVAFCVKNDYFLTSFNLIIKFLDIEVVSITEFYDKCKKNPN